MPRRAYIPRTRTSGGPLTTARPYSFGGHRAWRGAAAPTYGSPGSIDWPHASQVGRIPGWGRMKGPGRCWCEGLRHPDGHDARVRLLPRPERPDRVTQAVGEVVSLARDVVERDRPSVRRLEPEPPELDHELRVRSGSPPRIRQGRKRRGRSSRPRMMGTDGGETRRFESHVPIPEVRSLHIRA